MSASPLVVGFGGTQRANSSSERALRIALAGAEAGGAKTVLFDGPFLAGLPHYAPENPARTPEQTAFVDAIRRADGVIIATPAYHGGVSGLVKNAIDLIEDLAKDSRVYLDGRAVGLIVAAYGWQAVGGTMASMRSITHALRGWPTPLGAGLNASGGLFAPDGACTDAGVANTLDVVGRQVTQFALAQAALAAKA